MSGIDEIVLNEVCRIGQGTDCCRYLTMGPDGFSCVKLTPLKATLDARVDVMTAKGDNCEGIDP